MRSRMNAIDVGYTYLETMGLELIAGRDFSADFALGSSMTPSSSTNRPPSSWDGKTRSVKALGTHLHATAPVRFEQGYRRSQGFSLSVFAPFYRTAGNWAAVEYAERA